jgi:hypothetical protein
MDTIDRTGLGDAVADIELSDRARGALQRLVEMEATSIGDAISHAKGPDQLAAALDRAHGHLLMLRVAEAGACSVADARVCAVAIAKLRTDDIEVLMDDVRHREQWRLGDDGWRFHDDPAETDATYDRQISNYIDEIGKCDAFLLEVAR